MCSSSVLSLGSLGMRLAIENEITSMRKASDEVRYRQIQSSYMQVCGRLADLNSRIVSSQ